MNETQVPGGERNTHKKQSETLQIFFNFPQKKKNNALVNDANYIVADCVNSVEIIVL